MLVSLREKGQFTFLEKENEGFIKLYKYREERQVSICGHVRIGREGFVQGAPD